MSESLGASSAAPSSNPADGNQKSLTAQNVSADGAVALFMRMEQAAAQKTEAAATDAKATPEAQADTGETKEGGDSQQTAADDASQAESPEAETTTENADSEPQEGKEAESTEEAEGKADEVLSKEQSNLDDKTRQKIQKRIDREVGKRKALEEQLKQLNEKLNAVTQQPPQQAATAQAVPVIPVGNAPLPDIKDPAALADYAKKAKETKEWAEEILDRDDIDQGVQIGDKTYTKSEIKTVLRNARKALDDTIPAQREYFNQVNQFVQQKQNVTKLAHEKFPFLTDRNSEEYKAAQAMYQQSPWLHNLAASEMFIGAYLKGMKALVAEEKAAAAESKGKPKDEKPKLTIPKSKPPGDQSLVTTVGTPARLSPEARDSKAVRAQFDQLLGKRGVTADDAAKYLEQLDSVRYR